MYQELYYICIAVLRCIQRGVVWVTKGGEGVSAHVVSISPLASFGDRFGRPERIQLLFFGARVAFWCDFHANSVHTLLLLQDVQRLSMASDREIFIQYKQDVRVAISPRNEQLTRMSHRTLVFRGPTRLAMATRNAISESIQFLPTCPIAPREPRFNARGC